MTSNDSNFPPTSKDLVNSQRAYSEAKWGELTATPFDFTHRLHHWINYYPLYQLQRFFTCCRGDSFLTVCDGRGLEAQYLKLCGVADVLATDLQPIYLDALQRAGILEKCGAENAQSLSLPDESVDWGLVRNGLHHLPQPTLGIYELLRVARKGIIILEAQDSWLVRLLVGARLAEDYEESGNYVYRFTERELEKICRSLFLPEAACFTACAQYFRPLDQFLASQPSTNSVSRIFKQAILAGNLFLGRWGNSFNYICFKKARDATVNSTLAPIPGIRFRSFRTVK